VNLSPNAKLLSDYVVRSFQDGETPTEPQLKERMARLAPTLADIGKGTSDADRAEVLKDLLARLRVSMDTGTSLKEEDVKPWLDSRRASIDPFYWIRFKNFLQKDWSQPVLRAFDKVTDDILDLCGNPAAEEESWKRRGLVIGDVQSGKTATYTALSCKAADAGYQVIVLLAGSLESLRRQTQKRLDEGFAGLDSSEFLPSGAKVLGRSRAVGAGLDNQSRFAAVFTSRTRDFNKDVLNSRQLTLRAVKEPVLFVIKKHKSIIENLTTWLEAYNADSTGKISESLLLIDDEADNASINTNKEDTDPTAVNKSIRRLLGLFRRRTYVGFTATPFANVFIDPDTSDEDFHKEELFPRDFIYALDAPSNYIGAPRVFGDDASSVEGFIHDVEDADDIFPLKHKNSLVVDELPRSLDVALREFCIANAIRDLRGDESAHRSMLVNVSRFTAVQDRVRDLVDRALEDIKQHIRNFSKLPVSQALRSTVIADLKEVFEADYPGSGTTWAAVQAQLHESTAPITVRSVNQRAGAASLDYSKHEDVGLRVVAVGGNSLSRGLTLEGLCVSYFFRNAQAYDTLLQMGRWFGYRKGYEDLCRLWITADAQQWYGHVASAAEELRDEVRRMRRADLTPKDFGLKVRSHPDTLIVTARNKMRSAQTVIKQISWSAEGAETTKLRVRSNVANFQALRALLASLHRQGIESSPSEWGNPIFRAVPKQLVANFIDAFEVHPHNFKLYVAEDERAVYGLGSFLHATNEARLQSWDVVVPKGELASRELVEGGLSIRPLRRVVTTQDNDRTILISGTKARVGSRGVEREGLPRDLVEELTEQAKPKNVSDSAFRRGRTRPLLLIYPVVPHDKEKIWTGLTENDLFVAYGLSFPEFDDQTLTKTVPYRVNRTWLRDHAIDDEVDETDGDDVDD
jgi:Z1 domain